MLFHDVGTLSDSELLRQEFIKAIPGALITAIGALLALWVGKRVSHFWAVRQKQRELELTVLNEFYGLYGEFISLRRLWNRHKEQTSKGSSTPGNQTFLEKAADIEARMEGLLVKLAAERKLSSIPPNENDIDNLGLLRQAFQSLREKIRDDEVMEWGRSDHPQYVAFKSLSSKLATILLSDRNDERPSADDAVNQIKGITDNRHEKRWDNIK